MKFHFYYGDALKPLAYEHRNTLLLFVVESDSPIHNIRHVSAFAKELHDFLTGSGQLCPTGSCLRILLKPSNIVTIENKVHLRQSAFGGVPNGIAFRP